MNFREERKETLIPLFTGVLCALLSCSIIAVLFGDVFKPVKREAAVEITIKEEDYEDEFLLAAFEDNPDPVMEYFRDAEYREWVTDFFTALCSNREIAQAILDSAEMFDVPPALAFALSWEESKFNPRAVNRRNRDGSVDRGLFQLNNRSFPSLDNTAFFDIKSNARYGVGHLRHCLNSAGSEISALAMYNAGTGRVKTQGAPEVTLNYINRILENRRRIESRFLARLLKEEEKRLAQRPESGAQPQANRTLITASPLYPSL
jgi:hypothetical protein